MVAAIDKHADLKLNLENILYISEINANDEPATAHLGCKWIYALNTDA